VLPLLLFLAGISATILVMMDLAWSRLSLHLLCSSGHLLNSARLTHLPNRMTKRGIRKRTNRMTKRGTRKRTKVGERTGTRTRKRTKRTRTRERRTRERRTRERRTRERRIRGAKRRKHLRAAGVTVRTLPSPTPAFI
jgi:hypothetical protein